MRSQLRVLMVTLALGPVLVWGPRVPDALAGMETFRVSRVDVRGIRFITEDTVVARLQLGGFASVWGDKGAWEERVEAHPLVRAVEIDRRLPDGLLVTIEERVPVALAATPTLEPVDEEGRRLPIDPTRYRLDLPIIAADRMPPEASSMFPEDVRVLAAELEYLRAIDEDLVRRISTLHRLDDGALSLRLISPDVSLFVPLRTSVRRLREAEAALSDAVSRTPGRIPEVVDLRFQDQVVVRRKE